MKPVTLFLMTKKGYAFLQDVVDTYRHLIEVVVVGTDASLDEDHSDKIIALCEEKGLIWCKRTAEYTISSPFAMAVSWRWMINHPEQRLIVFHDSLLPRYRGFNPLVTALINGDAEAGVTALLGASEYDAGAILAQSAVEIRYPTMIAVVIDQLRAAYRACAFAVFAGIEQGLSLQGVPQDESQATYSLWRDEEDYRIPWEQPAAWIERFVDALGSPYKGAFTMVDGKCARITGAGAA